MFESSAKLFKNLEVSDNRGNLTLRGTKTFKGDWIARSYSDDFCIVQKKESECVEFAYLDSDSAYHVLRAKCLNKWTGACQVENSLGKKILFFDQGNIIQAGSDIVDDRLGEVIYRGGLITLDQWTDTASKVDRNKKFGHILIESEIFDHFSLWKALSFQIKVILESIFLSDWVLLRFLKNANPERPLAGCENNRKLLKSCHLKGKLFKSFCSRLQEDSMIYTVDWNKQSALFKNGTFAGDILQSIGKKCAYKGFLSKNKIEPVYSILALLDMVQKGICTIEGLDHFDKGNDVDLNIISAKIKKYQVWLHEVRQSFSAELKEIPVGDLRKMARKLSNNYSSPIFVDQDAYLDPESINQVLSVAKGDNDLTQVILENIDTFVLFITHICQDKLTEAGFNHVYKLQKELSKSA